MSVAVAPRVIFRRNTPRAHGTLASSAKRLSVDLLVGDVDVDAFRRHGQQFAIFDLFRRRADQVDRAPRAGRRSATTSPAWIIVSAVASMIWPPRRMRWTKTRCSGSSASASAA